MEATYCWSFALKTQKIRKLEKPAAVGRLAPGAG
jgi:hypothetical protein